MPLRRAPYLGAPVTVAFLGRRVRGTVTEIGADGRQLTVHTDEDELVDFALSPATGTFTEGGRAVGGARLTFD